MTPIDAVFEWLLESPGADQFEQVRGIWRGTESPDGQFAVLMSLPGRSPGPDTDYGMLRLLLLGAEEQPYMELEEFALSLQQRLRTDYKACGIAQILLTGGIIGPGLTEENRPWYELNLSIIT